MRCVMRKTFSQAAFDWNNFALVHFRADKNKKIPGIVHAWAEANLHIPMETCARQVWAGTNDLFKSFPAGDTAWDFRLLKGADAYAYLLQVGTGLHSPRVGEDHIVRQYHVKWEEFKAAHPEFEEKMRPLKTAFDHDNRLVRNEVVDHLIQPVDTHAIKILNGQQKGDRMMVVSYIAKDGNIEGDADKLIRFFGQDRNGRPLVNEIALSAASNNEAQVMARIVKSWQQQKRLHRDITITAVSPATMAQSFETYDRVIFTPPMGRTTKLDIEVITAWEGRIRRDNTLTCTRGASDLSDKTPPLWRNADLDNFVSPELIRNTLGRIATYNAHLIELANQGIEICADSRLKDQQLRKIGMAEKVQKDLRPASVMEKRPETVFPDAGATISYGSLELAVA